MRQNEAFGLLCVSLLVIRSLLFSTRTAPAAAMTSATPPAPPTLSSPPPSPPRQKSSGSPHRDGRLLVRGVTFCSVKASKAPPPIVKMMIVPRKKILCDPARTRTNPFFE